MLPLCYVLCVVCVLETWITPGAKGDRVQLFYFDKIAGGRSTLVLNFKFGCLEFQLTAFRWNESSLDVKMR